MEALPPFLLFHNYTINLQICQPFRRFESVYRPEMVEMHLQKFEKLYNKMLFDQLEKSYLTSSFLPFNYYFAKKPAVLGKSEEVKGKK